MKGELAECDLMLVEQPADKVENLNWNIVRLVKIYCYIYGTIYLAKHKRTIIKIRYRTNLPGRPSWLASLPAPERHVIKHDY